MRYIRPAFSAATAVLASLVCLGSAHAAGNNLGSQGSDSQCTIANNGDLDNITCGQLIVGNNNVTGTGPSVGLGSGAPLDTRSFSVHANLGAGTALQLGEAFNCLQHPPAGPNGGAASELTGQGIHPFTVSVNTGGDTTCEALYRILDQAGHAHGTVEVDMTTSALFGVQSVSCTVRDSTTITCPGGATGTDHADISGTAQ